MAISTRLTQQARETLASGGAVSARVTQDAREVVQLVGEVSARVTQDAREILFTAGTGPPAESIRETQAVLEHADYPPNEIRHTQADLEYVQYPPNDVWATQVVLEIAYHGEFGLAVACPYAISGTLGTPYSSGIGVSGGTGPYIFALTGGALPPGLTLNTSTGLISGTPAASGEYRYTVTAVDSTEAAVSMDCSIVICAGARNYAYIS